MNILLEEKFDREGQNRLNTYLKQVLYLENSNLFLTGLNHFKFKFNQSFHWTCVYSKRKSTW